MFLDLRNEILNLSDLVSIRMCDYRPEVIMLKTKDSCKRLTFADNTARNKFFEYFKEAIKQQLHTVDQLVDCNEATGGIM